MQKAFVMKLLFIFILLFNLSLCYSQPYSLNDFEECAMPQINDKEWFVFNHATEREFIFSLDSGKLEISKSKYNPSIEYSITNGKLIGVNMGEFGGGLYYKPIDSTKDYFINGKNARDIHPNWFGGLMVPERNPITKVIKNCILLQSGNVQFIFTFNDSIYIMGGLAHLSLSFGYLSTLRYNQDSFFISKSLNLDDAPSAMTIYKDLVYIATSKGFYTLDKALNKKTIFNNLFWEGLYPSSVVVLDEQKVLVTIRGGYVKINPQEKKMTLFKAK
jgi:hypothetical protein